ncbi:hypothetical protein LVY65_10030 [Sphingomonas sp. G124]|uniref:Uncharacterized protein n=1 Tax=Sphingomonas cremea TaxID=2904799 RepID=A0A9X1QMU1_9SPHN|nr:hypothetical protein [Sphingomonas cremea]MCF2515399.1 hypothetical protein [Sphingomonas cremea]
MKTNIVTDTPTSFGDALPQGCITKKPVTYEMPKAKRKVDLRRDVTSEKIISVDVMIALRPMTRMKEKSMPDS